VSLCIHFFFKKKINHTLRKLLLSSCVLRLNDYGTGLAVFFLLKKAFMLLHRQRCPLVIGVSEEPKTDVVVVGTDFHR